MEEPDFNNIGQTLLQLANNSGDNARIGERNLTLAIAEMIKVLAWSGFQQKDLVEETRRLNAHLVTLSDNSERDSRKLIRLTWGLIILTLGLLIFTAILLLKG